MMAMISKPKTKPAGRGASRESGKKPADASLKKHVNWKVAGGIAIIILLAVLTYLLVVDYTIVPFTTFKSNFQAAPRVAIAAVYYNSSQYLYVSQCAAYVIQMIGKQRNASTIDFFIMNRTTCYYSPTGLGHAITVSTKPASSCISLARSEPSIFLNYSSTNSTTVSAYHAYVQGNANYMRACGIAIGMS
jgi:hypothetical protein